MKRIAFALATLVLVTGCSIVTPARYSISIDTNRALEEYEGQHVILARLDPPESYSANCRLRGPIQGTDGRSIHEFIQYAYNAEFRVADVYGESGTRLTGKLDKIAFSSISGALTNSWWVLAITLRSPEGETLSVQNRYEFRTDRDGEGACKRTALALGAAVQDLVYKTVTHPDFDELIR